MAIFCRDKSLCEPKVLIFENESPRKLVPKAQETRIPHPIVDDDEVDMAYVVDLNRPNEFCIILATPRAGKVFRIF